MRKQLLALVAILLLSSCASIGPDRDVITPLNKLIERAESGDAEGQHRLGIRFTNGSGVSQNYVTAADWFKRASAQGHAGSQYMLGIAYSTGRGLAINQEIALQLFIRAATTGHIRAGYQLGEAYANGRGTTWDVLWASRWYETAARQKHAEALFSLGVFRAAGVDGIADLEQAWLWLQLAVDQKHSQAAAVRDRIMETMTAESLARARQRARSSEWSEKPSGFADPPTVRYVQRVLTAKGFNAGKADGIFGPRTAAAVSAFRKAHGAGAASSIDPDLISLLRDDD